MTWGAGAVADAASAWLASSRSVLERLLRGQAVPGDAPIRSLFAGTAAAGLGWLAWRAVRGGENKKKIPTIRTRGFLEVLWMMMRGHNALDILKKLRDKYGRVHQGPFFGFWFVYIMEPEGIKQVLMASDIFAKAQEDVLSPHAKTFMGVNVVFANGDMWRRHRRQMNPAFHFAAHRPLAPVFAKYGSHLCAVLEASGSKAVDAADLLQRFAIDVLGAAAFGRDFGAIARQNDDVLEAYNFALTASSSVWRFVFPWLDHLPTPANHRIRNAVAVIDKMLYSRIEACRQDKAGLAAPSNLLQMLVSSNEAAHRGDAEGLTDKELRDNLVIFLIAGHDTTAVALFYTLYSLAEHPEIQERARQEVDAILGNSPLRAPTLEDVAKLEYLNLVIKESMRKYPPVYSIPLRIVRKDVDLLGHQLPEGTLVSIPLHSVHNDPELWPEPDKFDPERFTPERSEGRHPFSYVPFLAGPRTCLGNNFSLLEQRIVLCMLLARFRIRLPDNAPPFRFSRESAIILKPATTNIVFEPRVRP